MASRNISVADATGSMVLVEGKGESSMTLNFSHCNWVDIGMIGMGQA